MRYAVEPTPTWVLVIVLIFSAAVLAFVIGATESDRNQSAFRAGYAYADTQAVPTVADCQHYVKLGKVDAELGEGFWLAGCYNGVDEKKAK